VRTDIEFVGRRVAEDGLHATLITLELHQGDTLEEDLTAERIVHAVQVSFQEVCGKVNCSDCLVLRIRGRPLPGPAVIGLGAALGPSAHWFNKTFLELQSGKYLVFAERSEIMAGVELSQAEQQRRITQKNAEAQVGQVVEISLPDEPQSVEFEYTQQV
jgi:hypothetical protein